MAAVFPPLQFAPVRSKVGLLSTGIAIITCHHTADQSPYVLPDAACAAEGAMMLRLAASARVAGAATISANTTPASAMTPCRRAACACMTRLLSYRLPAWTLLSP